MESSPPRPDLRKHVLLFVATFASVFATYRFGSSSPTPTKDALLFAGALLAILVTHEFGHYLAARIHRVEATLPFFIPLPFLSPFGTMGAVIRMDTIRSRRALLDIGAAGPLAGMGIATLLYAIGVSQSTIVAKSSEGTVELGTSILLHFLDRIFGPSVPVGMDLLLSPVAYAAWAGMFVTFVNLLPFGQLDGGHVAHALFLKRQPTVAKVAHRFLLLFFFVGLILHVVGDFRTGAGFYFLGRSIRTVAFWFFWFQMVGLLGDWSSDHEGSDEEEKVRDNVRRVRLFGTISLALLLGVGRTQHSPYYWFAWLVGALLLLAFERRVGSLSPDASYEHPAVDRERLGWGRFWIGIAALLLFVLLFLPVPMTM